MSGDSTGEWNGLTWARCVKCEQDFWWPQTATFELIQRELEEHECWPTAVRLTERPASGQVVN